MKKVIEKLKNTEGSSLLEIFALLFVCLFFIFLVTDIIYPVIVTYNDLTRFVNLTCDEIRSVGEVNTEVYQAIEVFKDATIEPDYYTFDDSEFMYGTRQIQLGDNVVVYARKDIPINFWKFNTSLSLDVEVTQSSGVYWKD